MERLKWVTVFWFSQLHLSTFQNKPFNPILGETCQMKIGDLDVYFEHVIHKPPVAAIYGTSPLYTIHGFWEVDAKTGANSIKAYKKGNYYITFSDGHKFELKQAVVSIKGTTVGKRTFNFSLNSYVSDRVSSL